MIETSVMYVRIQTSVNVFRIDAIAIAIQVCQAVSFINRRGLRVNDICPESVVWGADGRINCPDKENCSDFAEMVFGCFGASKARTVLECQLTPPWGFGISASLRARAKSPLAEIP